MKIKLLFLSLLFAFTTGLNAQLLYTKSWPSHGVNFPPYLSIRELQVYKDSTVVFMNLRDSYFTNKKDGEPKWIIALPDLSDKEFAKLHKLDLNMPRLIISQSKKSVLKYEERIKRVNFLRDSIEKAYSDNLILSITPIYGVRYVYGEWTPGYLIETKFTFKALPEGVKTLSIIELTKNGLQLEKIDVKPVNKTLFPDIKASSNVKSSITFPTNWDERKLMEYWSKNDIKKNEGIYEDLSSAFSYKVALKYNVDSNYYELIYLSATNMTNWTEGELKAILKPTGSFVFYDTQYNLNNKQSVLNYFSILSGGILRIYTQNKESVVVYNKTFPKVNPTELPLIGTGTGFALNSLGYVATNSHVVSGAEIISIRGVNGDFTRLFQAKVVIDDKINDLAIVKIIDPEFKSLGNIPYQISGEIIDVGNTIYTLGYPMTSLLGDEIKFTSGSISAKSGFRGDVTTYQMSTPIQGGNSGGPVFNSKGSVVGIVNAKIIKENVDNVSYCIKSNYLLNLVDNLEPKIMLPVTNTISTKGVSEQIKAIKNFVYIIEIR